MIPQRKLEDLIREKVNIGPPDSRGFHPHKCPQCNDYKPRAGLKFSDGLIGFNCFNCGSSGTYTEFSGRISKNFRRILNSYGLEDSEISSVVNSWFFRKKDQEMISLATLRKLQLQTPTIDFPEKTLPLGADQFLEYQEKLVAYLLKRRVDILKYKFFFSLQERMINRVIIPFYKNNSLIYWQARAIDDNPKRYDNPFVPRKAVLFNHDQLFRYSNGPLFVTEGVFDAMMLDGVALLSSKLTDEKVHLLSQSPRRIVFVIDKDSNGRALAEAALERGWEITFTPSGTDDLNHSIQRFGTAYTIYDLMQNIRGAGDLARLSINLNCKG